MRLTPNSVGMGLRGGLFPGGGAILIVGSSAGRRSMFFMRGLKSLVRVKKRCACCRGGPYVRGCVVTDQGGGKTIRARGIRSATTRDFHSLMHRQNNRGERQEANDLVCKVDAYLMLILVIVNISVVGGFDGVGSLRGGVGIITRKRGRASSPSIGRADKTTTAIRGGRRTTSARGRSTRVARRGRKRRRARSGGARDIPISKATITTSRGSNVCIIRGKSALTVVDGGVCKSIGRMSTVDQVGKLRGKGLVCVKRGLVLPWVHIVL